MPTKPTGAAALLEGLAEWLAHELLKEAARHEAMPETQTDIESERRVRKLGAIARTALTIHKLEEREALLRESSDTEEADMDEQSDHAAVIERKYQQLFARIAAFTARTAAGDNQETGDGGDPRSSPDQLARGREQGTA